MEERAAKRLLERCRSSLTAFCPTMDLVATVSDKDVVDVWRYNGQRVFGLALDDDQQSRISGLAWKSDGKMLATAMADGTMSLIDSFSGKVAHQLQARIPDGLDGSSRQSDSVNDATRDDSWMISWHRHFTDIAQTRRQLAEAESTIGLDALLGLNADIRKLLKAKSNLPRELAIIEVDVALPKLSTLPATGADNDVFSTRQSVDNIFHTQNADLVKGKDSGPTVDVILRLVPDCLIHVSIFDSFTVGTIDLRQALPKGLKATSVVHETSHPFLTTHFIAVTAVADGPESKQRRTSADSLHLLGMDLRFISQTSYTLPILVTKATQLQNLLRYIQQVSDQLSAEVRTAFDLPSRFVENINETLAEEDESVNFMTEAYRLIVTGVCDDKFREWLVDQVGDRGLKRWEKAVGDCLDMIRRMTSECLAPAVERAEIVLSRLDGLSRFADVSSRLGLDAKDIRAVREALDALTIHCEDMLRDACTEIREFAAFMRWLKWETEVQTLGEDSERAEEMRETYNGEAEMRTVLDYIESAMKKSRLMRYISNDSKQPPSEALIQDTDLMASYKKVRNAAKSTELPKLSDLVQVVRRRSHGVFQSIAEALRKNILVSYITELPNVTKLDSQIVAAVDSEQFMLHIVGQEQGKEKHVTHIAVKVEVDSRRSHRITRSSSIELHGDYTGTMLSLKMADDDGVLALVTDGSGQNRAIVRRSLSEDKGQWETLHLFADGNMGHGMIPGKVLVNQREDRRGIVVLDEEEMGFVVFEVKKT
jgi:anaphase-promoting complex subunit 4